MVGLYDFIFESSVSDETALYTVAKHIWDGWLKFKRDEKDKRAQANYIKKYNIDLDNPRAGYIKFARHELYPLEDPKDEIIKRSEWDLKGICGETKKQIHHKHFEYMQDWFLKNYKKKHDILVIFPCALAKPYFEDHMYKWYLERYDDVCDFAYVSNPGIIPNEYCNYYPFRYYEWNERNEKHHGMEQDELMDYYDDILLKRFLKWVKNFKYKRVLILMPHPYAAKFALNARRDNPENINNTMKIVIDEQFIDRALKSYPQLDNGLIYTRILELDVCKERFARMVNKELSKEEQEKHEYHMMYREYAKGHKHPEKASEQEIEEWYKEFKKEQEKKIKS